MGLWYPKDSCIALTAFVDADHAGCQDTKKSTSRSMQLLGDRLVSWSSKKQKSTAISSTEAEYIALTILDICPRVEGVNFTDVPDDDTTLAFLIKLGYKDDQHEGEISRGKTCHSPDDQAIQSLRLLTRMLFKYSTGQIPPKNSKGKGSQRKKTTDDSQEAVDVSEESEPEPKPVKRKTSSKRRVKKKVTLSVDDDVISDDPDTALELRKSISKAEAEEAEAARQVHATHARIVTESVPKPTRRRKSGKGISNPPKKLKGIPSLTLEEQEAVDIIHALKESKKTSKRQPGTRGSSKVTCTIPGVPDEFIIVSATSSKGIGTKPGVPDEEKDITKENVILKWGSKQESEYLKEDKLDDEEKDDEEGDAEDEDTIMSDSEHSTITYTSVSEDDLYMGSPGVEVPIYEGPPSPDYIPGPEGPPSPDYVPGPEEPEQAPPSPIYIPFVPEPVYPEFLPVDDEVFPAEEQPLPAADSPTHQSPGYLPESDPEEDLEEDDEEDPEEDPADYPADRGDDDDEHLAPAEPAAVAYSADQDPYIAYRVIARMSIRTQAPTPFLSEEVAERGNQDSRRKDAWNSGNKDRRRSGKQEDSKALVTVDGEGVDWTSHSKEEEDYALMACSSSGLDTEVTSCSKECKESYAKLKKLYDEQRAQLSDASIEIKAYTQALKKVEAQLVVHQQGQLWYEEKIRFIKIDLDDKTDVLTYHKKLLAEAEKEKEDLKAKVEKWHNSSKNLGKLLNTQMSANDKFGLGYGDYRYDGILSYENEVLQSVFMNKEGDLENQPLYDRFVTAEGMHAVPPPMTGNYMSSGPDIEIDYSQFTYGPKQSQPSESETQTSDFDTCESNCSDETHESLPEPAVNEPKVVSQPKVWSDAPIIEEYKLDSEDEHVSLPTEE
ncbi:hypothetical protein Tco_0092158 [Tanacetum coccineum]